MSVTFRKPDNNILFENICILNDTGKRVRKVTSKTSPLMSQVISLPTSPERLLKLRNHFQTGLNSF